VTRGNQLRLSPSILRDFLTFSLIDIDIVIVTNFGAPKDKIALIESQLLTTKKIYLTTPNIGEELDFIVKPIDKMLEQLSYGDIHQKIASKILYESYFLMGRVDIYQTLMKHLKLRGTQKRDPHPNRGVIPNGVIIKSCIRVEQFDQRTIVTISNPKCLALGDVSV